MKKHLFKLLSSMFIGLILTGSLSYGQPNTNLLQKVGVVSVNKLTLTNLNNEGQPTGTYAYIQLGFVNTNGFAVGIQKEEFDVILDAKKYVPPQIAGSPVTTINRLWETSNTAPIDSKNLGKGVFVREYYNEGTRTYTYSVDTEQPVVIESSNGKLAKTIRVYLGPKGDSLTQQKAKSLLNAIGSRPVSLSLNLEGSGEFGMQLMKPNGEPRGWVFTDKLSITFEFIPLLQNTVIME